ncbi:MAG: glycosyltransferase [Betaproteobacteria bacterium]
MVVAYFPAAELLDHLDAILDEVPEIIVVDNASEGESRKVLDAAQSKPGVSLLQHPENLGLGAALNAGIRWAESRGYGYVMTFDQDTHPVKGLLETYARIYDVVDKQSLGCVGANYRDPHTGAQLIHEGQCVGKSFAPVDLLITSGTLVPITLFERAGGYREDYFVDLTDHEMCLRTQSLGYHHYISVPVGLTHSLGFPTIHTFMGFHWIAYNYSPLRYYYMARNFMLMFPMRR